jgi:hypothetical protein
MLQNLLTYPVQPSMLDGFLICKLLPDQIDIQRDRFVAINIKLQGTSRAVFRTKAAPHAVPFAVEPAIAVLEIDGAEMAGTGACAAIPAFFDIINYRVAGLSSHGEAGVELLGKPGCLKAHAAIGAAVAEDACTSACGHLEKGLRDMPAFAEIFYDIDGLGPGYKACIVFLAVIDPESSKILADRKAPVYRAAVSKVILSFFGHYARAIHHGYAVGILQDNLVGIVVWDDTLVFFRSGYDIFIEGEYLGGVTHA